MSFYKPVTAVCWFNWPLEIALRMHYTFTSCNKSVTPQSFFFFQRKQEFMDVVFWPDMFPWTSFSDVWLTVQNSSGLAWGPWAISSPTQPDSKRWREVDSDNSNTPPCLFTTPQGQTLPACLFVAADRSQNYMCLSMHPPDVLCWHCSFMPIRMIRCICLFQKLSTKV